MFPGVFRRNPDSFKLVLEYGRDSLADLAGAGGQVRLTVALATLEFEFSSDEGEGAVLERFTQAKSRITVDRLEERVVLKLAERHEGPGVRVKLSTACRTPALRSLQVLRTSGTGSAPEALLTALFKHCDLSGVWKLRGAEGFGHFWCSCCELGSWRSLANMNLSSCGLTSIPPALSSLATLRILRLSHNKLTTLPPEVSALTALEVLQADHNQLTSLPAELRRCSSLRHLELEENRLAAPVLDLRALSNLVSLQLYGNPLEYLPELSPASALRSLSLANVRILADKEYSRWEVEVAAQSYYLTQSYRGHKLAPLFKLTFRRSSCQHPLLAGALGRISEERANCELMAREETAIQQLVLMALSEQPVVAEQACRTLGALAQLGLATARRLLAHDVLSTIVTLLRSPRRAGKLCGLTLLGSVAAASEAVSSELLTLELLQLLQACIREDDRELRVAALTALANVAFCRDNKLKIRAAKDLLDVLIQLAAEPAADSVPFAHASPTAAAALRSVAPAEQLQPQQQDGPVGPSSQVPLPQPLQSQAQQSQQPQSGSSRARPLRHGSDGLPGAGPRAPTPQPQPSTADEAPGVVRMPSRAANAGGGGGSAGSSQRHSDTGSSNSMLASFWVGSPPGSSSLPGLSTSVGGSLAAGASTAPAAAHVSLSVGGAPAAGSVSPYRASGGTLAPAAQMDLLSPPSQQQQPRSLHHSASTPAAVGMAAASAGSGSSSAAATTAGGAPLSPTAAAGPLSPTSPTGAEPAAAAATASGLPPQIALAPPRAVPEPVARRDQGRLLALKVLAILGENEVVRRALGHPPISGRGVRVLALDGGGMRGLALVQIMRQIERRTRRPLYELFDLMVGTSTGAIVAFGLGVFHFSLDQCESIYTGLGHKVFNQSNASGPTAREELLAAQAQAQAAAQAAASAAASSTSGASASSSAASWRDSLFRVMRGTSTNLRVAVYGFKHDATTFEELLRQMCDAKKLGCVSNQLIDAAVLGSPKVAAVATLVSCCPVTPFLFTSYELPPEVAPAAAAMRACPSSSRHQLWQAVRASSAAPYYLDDFVCGDDRYQDGAATANNPSILALQQARLLWPGVQLDALVSLGCGAAPSVRRERGAHAVLDTGAVLVDAATSPDRADEALSTLLPLVPGVKYFRFQPVHERCSMELDDVNPQHWAALQAAVDEYCTAHAARLDELAELLLSGRDDGDAGAQEGTELAAGGRGSGGVEAEAEEPFEVPPGVGPDGGPLPPVPRVRLGPRRGVVVLESLRAAAHPVGGGDCGRPTLGLDPEQLVVEALARRPQTLRRCDIAATAADAALSAALVAAHIRHLDEQQQPQQQIHAAQVALESQSRSVLGTRAGSAGSIELLAAPVATAAAVAAEAAEEQGPRRERGELVLSVAGGPAGAAASAGGLMSPTRAATAALPLPRAPGGGSRHWLSGSSGRGAVSVGGWVLPAAGGAADGAGGQLEVAGEVVAAEEAAAAAAAAAAASAVATAVPISQPSTAEPAAAVPAAAAGPSSVASAAVEAVAAAGGDSSPTASAAPDASSGSSTAGASASTSSAAPSAASLLYDFLFVGKRSSSARGMSVGGNPGASAGAAPGAGSTAAAAAATATTTPGAPTQTVAAAASAGAAAESTPGTPAGEAALGGPLAAQLTDEGASSQPRAAAAPRGAVVDGLAHMPSLPGGLASPEGRSGGSASSAAAERAEDTRAYGADGAGGPAAVAEAGFAAPEVQPAVLVASLLQDLQGRCGLVHLALRCVYGSGAVADEECGLVASWRQEVVAVVEPGPDADRILAELGHKPAGGSSGRTAPSLSSLFAAAKGAPLESSSCCSYKLLARQEVWHGGSALATLLLQVTQPASLLRPSDFTHMAAQLSGLVVTAAAPLPPAVIAAMLSAGAAAVLCPTAPLQRPSAAPARPPLAPVVPTAPSLPCLVLPYSAAGGGGQRPSAQQLQQQQPPQQVSRPDQQPGSIAAAAAAGGPGAVEGVRADSLVGYFEVLVGELVEGATVQGALVSAERQHAALRGRIVFHHL